MEPMVVAEAAIMVEPVMAPSAERSAPVSVTSGPRRPAAPAGVVTAGDIDDGLNLNAFNRFLSKARRETRLPQSDFNRPVLAQLVGPEGQPAPGQRVTLYRPGAAEPFYDGYSGVDGRVTVFPGVHGVNRPRQVEMRVFSDGQDAPVVQTIRTGETAQVRLPFADGWNPDFMDLVFVVDTTGSMGDELRWLTAEMRSFVSAARRAAPGVDIRYGLVVYRDHGDQYVVRNHGFTSSQTTMNGWLQSHSASGGGDYPEAAAEALQSAVQMQWRRGRGERLIFHIADAPPHDADAGAYLRAAEAAARNGVQIFGLGASGVAAESEYLMRQAAAQTNGRYLFLTDDSGVGNAHAEPTISCYRVTRLSDLMRRVLASELTGLRVEASGADVMRTVGTYRRGVCQN